jgi:hypothetical protein
MTTKHHKMQQIIRLFKEETGETEVEMLKIAKFAASRGWRLPTPKTAIEMLAKEFAEAARTEVRRDAATGRPYRANHALLYVRDGTQMSLWIDIDEAPRPKMLKSLIHRREQMVGDGLQLSLDADHWNSVNTDKEPIDIPLDFTLDVQWRKNGPEEGLQAA